MKSCKEYELLLQQLADGELPPAQKARLWEHLDSCPHCREQWQFLLTLRDSFASMETEVPSGLHENIMEAVRRTPQQAPRKKLPRWSHYAAMAACLLLVLGLGWGTLFGDRGGSDDNFSAAPAQYNSYENESSSDTASLSGGANGDNVAPYCNGSSGGEEKSADRQEQFSSVQASDLSGFRLRLTLLQHVEEEFFLQGSLTPLTQEETQGEVLPTVPGFAAYCFAPGSGSALEQLLGEEGVEYELREEPNQPCTDVLVLVPAETE